MKRMLALALVMSGFVALQAAEAPLITKFSGAGFVMPEYANSERCDVYQNKVVITHGFGTQGPTALGVTEERKITLTNSLTKLIQIAKTEKVEEKENMLCDGPTTTISAAGDVLLYFTGACGTPSKTRVGFASSKLVSLISLYCEKTY